jgi:hypothetical protein
VVAVHLGERVQQAALERMQLVNLQDQAAVAAVGITHRLVLEGLVVHLAVAAAQEEEPKAVRLGLVRQGAEERFVYGVFR